MMFNYTFAQATNTVNFETMQNVISAVKFFKTNSQDLRI